MVVIYLLFLKCNRQNFSVWDIKRLLKSEKNGNFYEKLSFLPK